MIGTCFLKLLLPLLVLHGVGAAPAAEIPPNKADAIDLQKIPTETASTVTAIPIRSRSADEYGMYFAIIFYFIIFVLVVVLISRRLRRLRHTTTTAARHATVVDALLSFFPSVTGVGNINNVNSNSSGINKNKSNNGIFAVQASSPLSTNAGSGGGGGGVSSGSRRAISSAQKSTPHMSTALQTGGVAASLIAAASPPPAGAVAGGQGEKHLLSSLQRHFLSFFRRDGPRGSHKEKHEDTQNNGDVAVVVMSAPNHNVEKRETGGAHVI